MSTDCSQQLTFWELGTQQVTVDFEGGRVVTDTGLLPIRLLDKELGVLATIAERLPDPVLRNSSPTPAKRCSRRRSIKSSRAMPMATTPKSYAGIRSSKRWWMSSPMTSSSWRAARP